jgi:hypothetical protein
MTDKYEGPKLVAFIIFALVGIPYSWWANAFVLSHVWNWYLPPFAPAMSFKAALGFSFVVWVLLHNLFKSKNKRDEERESAVKLWVDLILAASVPWLVLGSARVCFWMFFE